MNTTTQQTEIKFTRQDYLNNKCTHREYYGQFINPTILSRIANKFGVANLKEALQKNEHFNTIPLVQWDGFVQSKQLFDVSPKMKLAGDFLTLAGGVCIAKEAARQIAETN